MTVDEISRRFEILGHPTRLAIYQVLGRAGLEGLSVGRIGREIGIAASTLTHHLQKLAEGGLVIQERHGTTVICRANDLMMQALVAAVIRHCRVGVIRGRASAAGLIPPGMSF